MKRFMEDDFLLETETARRLFEEHAKEMPICDFHNHLDAKEIYEDGNFSSISQAWLSGDHYKWRALRADGVPEEYITGDADDYEKFKRWAEVLPDTFGNPLYHWTHLELRRYFGIIEPLTKATADETYTACNRMLREKEYSIRNLLRKMNVKVVCTTNDPLEELQYHKALKGEFEIQVLPTFRPDKVLSIDKPDFAAYVKSLSETVGYEISSAGQLEKALQDRVTYFDTAGCCLSDHSLDGNIYARASVAEINEILTKGLTGKTVDEADVKKYKGYFLQYLGTLYHQKGWAMQLHIGALRNNSKRMFEAIGADTGFDSMDDISYAKELSALLDAMDYEGKLPKTVLYCLNPKDNEMLASMAGNFQDGSCKGKVQFGAAWWFGDQKKGMKDQMAALSQTGLLSTFVGMVTDSRSFLSFTRHEYFRRILCNEIGNIVENGEYPYDFAYLGNMVENICCRNAMVYFGFKEI